MADVDPGLLNGPDEPRPFFDFECADAFNGEFVHRSMRLCKQDERKRSKRLV
jgi:hypothetical protein